MTTLGQRLSDLPGKHALFVVHLAKRRDRVSHLDAECRKHGLLPIVFPAFDGGLLYDAELRHSVRGRGEIGAYLSHLAILKMAQAMNLDFCTTAEDDFEFAPDLEPKLDKYWQAIPGDWQAIYFGGYHDQPPTVINEEVCQLRSTWALTFQILRRPLIDQLVEEAERRIFMAVDVHYAALMGQKPFYCSRSPLVGQTDSFSDTRGCDMNNDFIKVHV